MFSQVCEMRVCLKNLIPLNPLVHHHFPANLEGTPIPIGSMYAILMVTWIPSIYPLYVIAYIAAPWIRHGIGITYFQADPCGYGSIP